MGDYSDPPDTLVAQVRAICLALPDAYEEKAWAGTRWMVRKKKDRIPQGADERDRARFQKSQSYMVLLDDKVACKNLRCRKRFDISGVKTMAFLNE